MGLLDKLKKMILSESPASEIKNEDSVTPFDQTGFETKTNSKNTDNVNLDKAKDFIKGTVEEVKQQSSQLWDEIKDKAADLDEATKDYREKLAQKATDAMESIDHFVDDTLEKAKKLQDEEALNDRNHDGYSDKPIQFNHPADTKNENFFDKAEEWLEKNKSTNQHSISDGEVKSNSENHKIINPVELPKDPQ